MLLYKMGVIYLKKAIGLLEEMTFTLESYVSM